MSFWDKNYSGEEYRYGIEPVPFLVDSIAGRPAGRALCIGAGEGRNAVWLAQQGWDVTALDESSVGLEKATKLADARNVTIRTVAADAAAWDAGEERWDLVTMFFVHPPPEIRIAIQERVKGLLAPGGLFVMEAFTPRQLEYGTGGPGTSKSGQPGPPAEEVAKRFIEPEDLRRQMAGLEIRWLEEKVITLTGGTHHDGGEGAVVHCIAENSFGPA